MKVAALAIDHLAAWLPDRDQCLSAIAAAVDVGTVDGWAPRGSVLARGLKFSSGRFLDLHQTLEGEPPRALLALEGDVANVATLAAERGWKAKLHSPADSPGPGEAPPWSTVSFRRGQGLLSHLFAIEYHMYMRSTPEYSQPLYTKSVRPAGTTPPDLVAVWIAVDDIQASRKVASDLSGHGGDAISSRFAPYSGLRFRFGGADLVLTSAHLQQGEGIRRVDISSSHDPMECGFSANLKVVVGE